LLWHLQHGVLRDASILQSLVLLAAQDGNIVVLSLLMPLFKQRGWLVSVRFGSMKKHYYRSDHTLD
jgi:hypothetical protein